MVVLERLLELSHNVAILPQMRKRLLLCSMLRTWLMHYRFKVKKNPLSRPPLTTLVIIPCTVVSHKIISFALTVTALIGRVMLLSPHTATLLSLPRSFILRVWVLGTIRIGILDKSRHELTHVTSMTFKPPKLLLEWKETAIFLQH